MMRRLFMAVVLLVPLVAMGAEGGGLPFNYKADLGNKASLQRGAQMFMNYCSGCHTLEHMRYSTIARDLGIPEDIMKNNLMMTTDEIRHQIRGTMPAKSADWFGSAPPDLTLMARQHDASWLYSFLSSFYIDNSRVSGVNNLVAKNTAMPWVLWPLQGYQKLVQPADDASDAEHAGEGSQFDLVQKGSLSPKEFHRAVGDLVNFLVYVGEPMQLVRYSLGVKVIIFLLIFTVLAYLLKREYWRDVH